ncbi:MAG: PIG-L family deacetylase [Terriglobales bacterium]
MANLRLLCITAHPDDESGGFGGSLALYQNRGVETFVICLTPGQAATHRGGYETDAELAVARRAEFESACKLLKVTRGAVLDYPDAHLDNVSLYQAVADLTQLIRQIRPQVIITFGPDGAITAHPDHSMASVFATLAYQWAGRNTRFPEQLKDQLRPYRPQKLYYSTADFTLPDRPPVALAPSTAVIDVGRWLDMKVAAFKMHTTQAPLFPLFEQTVRLRGKVEMYHLAACIVPGFARQEQDLFTGVTPD